MVTKHVKRITTSSKLYLALSGLIALHGFLAKDVTSLAFSMWMIQTANYFKKEKQYDVNGDCARVTSIEGCDVHHH